MQPDILAATIAFIRTQSAIVTAFGEDLSAVPQPSIKFFSDWAGEIVPALPYLVLTEPQSIESFETIATEGMSNVVSSMMDGLIAMEVFASSKTAARQLADQVAAVVDDCEDALNTTLANIGVFYVRRTAFRFPVVTNVGPDGSATSFARIIQFRYLYEQTP